MARPPKGLLLVALAFLLAAIALGGYAWLQRAERIERERHLDHSGA